MRDLYPEFACQSFTRGGREPCLADTGFAHQDDTTALAGHKRVDNVVDLTVPSNEGPSCANARRT